MKLKHLALSLLSASIACVSHSSPISVTGFSAGDVSVQGEVGYLHLGMLTGNSFEGAFGFPATNIDISMASNTDEMAAIIIETSPDSLPALMLENYPEPPNSQVGIDAYRSVTGMSLSTTTEYQDTISKFFQDNRYKGVNLNLSLDQALVTQTADYLVISNNNQDGLGVDFFLCSTDAFSSTIDVSEQEACNLLDTVPDTDLSKSRTTPNGSFQSNMFVLNSKEGLFGQNKTQKIYHQDVLKEISATGNRVIAPNHSALLNTFTIAYDHTPLNGIFFFYRPDGEDQVVPTIGAGYPVEPESILYIEGISGFYDSENEDGDRVLYMGTSTPLPGYPDIEELPIPLQQEGNTGYGFSDQMAVLLYRDEGFFSPDSAELLGLAYYGSEDLNVYTPVIYDLDSGLFTYLSSVAVRELRGSTPAGFIDAVEDLVINSLPAPFAESYPELPMNLTGLNIDPNITPIAFQALINEVIVRTATGGALQKFLAGEPMTINTGFTPGNRQRWQSNELQFTSSSSLRAPFVSYAWDDKTRLEATIETNSTTLTSGEDVAELTLSVTGEARRLRASCHIERKVDDQTEAVFGELMPTQLAGMSVTSNTLSFDKKTLFITYQADEIVTFDGVALTVDVEAVSGTGELPVNCFLSVVSGLGKYQSKRAGLTLSLTSGLTITGQFTSSDNSLTSSDIRSANLIDGDGRRLNIDVNEDLSFSKPAGSNGVYDLTASAPGYIFQCASVNADSETTDIGTLTFLRGDVTGDGIINNSDIWRYYFRYFYSSTDFDLNGDGTVNSSDLAVIRENQGATQCDL